MHCSSKHVGDSAYFSKLSAAFADPRVARAFHQHLDCRNLDQHIGKEGTKFNLQKMRPMTEYYREVQLSGMPIIKRYVSAMMNDAISDPTANEFKLNNFRTSDTTTLFRQCLQFISINRYLATYTASSFTRELVRIEGFSGNERFSNGAKYFTVNCSIVIAGLKRINAYDTESSLKRAGV